MKALKKTRVLHLLEACLGGTRKHVLDLIENLDPEKFEITFGYSLLRADQNFLEALPRLKQQKNLTLIELPMQRSLSLKADGWAFLKLAKLFRSHRFDIVHCHSAKAGFLGRLAAKAFQPSAKTIYTPNALPTHLSRWFGYLEKLASFWTDTFVAVCDSEKEEMQREGIASAAKTVVIPSGISPPSLPVSGTLRETLKLKPKDVLITTVGRLCEQKDPLTFLRAAKRVVEEAPHAHFLWIGDGELRAEAEHFVKENGLGDKVTFSGWRTDVGNLLAQSDVFALSSRWESFGYVTGEAMIAGLPVVATRVTGSCDLVIDAETGFLVPVENVPLFAEKLLCLIQDPSRRLAMGKAAKQQIEREFSLSAMVEKTAHLYFNLSGQRGRHFWEGRLAKSYLSGETNA